MSDLGLQIQEDMKSAMRAGEKARLGAIRLIVAAIRQKEIDTRQTLDDTGIVAILDKMAKQRRDSIEQFTNAGRNDLADRERLELEIITGYMPTALGEEEVDALIDTVISETGASGMKDMGVVMGRLKPQLQGRADMGTVSAKVRTRLSV